MPKMRVTEINKLPTGTARFPDVTPALKEAYLAKVAEGKVTHLPQTVINHGDGYTTTTTVSVWNNKSDWETFKTWAETNFRLAKSEYYFAIHKEHHAITTLSQQITESEED